MARTRVLIVDDSVAIRRLVDRMLSDDPQVEVVGTASGGRTALDKLDQLSPDVVLLDVEMPEMDGLETLAAIRRLRPRLPVVMFSRHTSRGAAITLQALTMGATDYVNKPDRMSESPSGVAEVQAELLTKLRGLSPSASKPAAADRRAGSPRRRFPHRHGAVLIGVSTGGPNALATLVAGLPAELPVPVFIVQHMPALFTKLLAERLATRCRLPVQGAADGQPVVPGVVYMCPGDYHTELVEQGDRMTTRLHQGPPENSCRPSVDVLFRSAAFATPLAVVLTGMGQDGLRGAELVREAGGSVLAQDEASSVVWGMPGAIVRAGLADGVFPIDEMAAQIVSRIGSGRTTGRSGITEPTVGR